MRILLLVAAAMAAFAGNSLLCRLALRTTAIDPGSFTAIRIVSGAVVLWAIVRVRRFLTHTSSREQASTTPSTSSTGLTRDSHPSGDSAGRASAPAFPRVRDPRIKSVDDVLWARGTTLGGDWVSAAALFGYAAAFSFAYVGLTAGTGALLLFGAVQATMMGVALVRGERLCGVQWCGLVVALGGLLALLLPGLAAPSPGHAGLMLAAGVAWGVYTIRGRGAGDATAATAGNFVLAVPMAALLALAAGREVDAEGASYAVLSGAVTSGLGYALWYKVLPVLPGTVAATVQLCVPALAALGAVAVLAEPLTPRLVVSSAAILGGIALVTFGRRV